MKQKSTILLLVALIAVLALGSTIADLFFVGESSPKEFTSVHGETISLYGNGFFRYDSVSTVAQGLAQDAVTLFLGIPLLIYTAYLFNKGTLRGKLMLAGTLGYFLYTYLSYTFLVFYNPFFLVYVALYSLSLFALILTLLTVDLQALPGQISDRLPRAPIAGFLFFIGLVLTLMWLGRLAPSFTQGLPPVGLEHYTTLIIQAMDLGLIVPLSILAGVLLLKKSAWGYLITSVVVFKGMVLLIAIMAMIINQALAGLPINPVETGIFLFLTIVGIGMATLFYKNVPSKV